MGTMSRLLFLALVLGAGTACSSMDVSQPIVLAPSDELSDQQVQDLTDAAHSWNVYFASSFVVSRERDDDPQVVEVGLSDFLCGYSAGQTDYTRGSNVTVCDALPEKYFFYTVQHELGHVLNIADHASDLSSVMHERIYHTRSFSYEDRQMFYSANPEFAPTSRRCGMHIVEDSGSVGIIIQYQAPVKVGKRFLVFLSESTTDTTKARVGRFGSDSEYELEQTTAIQWPGLIDASAVGTDSELILFGHIKRNGKLMQQVVRVDPHTMKASAPVDLASGGLVMMDAVWDGQEIVAAYYTDSGMEIYRIRLQGAGNSKQLVLADKTANAAWVAYQSGATYGAFSDASGFRIAELGATGAKPPGSFKWPRQFTNAPRGRVIGGIHGLVLAMTSKTDSVYIASIRTPELQLQRSVQLKLPVECIHAKAVDDSVILAEGGRLALAISCYIGTSSEVFMTLLDEASLKQVMPWTMISAPDRARSSGPSLAVRDGNLIAFWSEGKLAYKVALWDMRSATTMGCPPGSR